MSKEREVFSIGELTLPMMRVSESAEECHQFNASMNIQLPSPPHEEKGKKVSELLPSYVKYMEYLHQFAAEYEQPVVARCYHLNRVYVHPEGDVSVVRKNSITHEDYLKLSAAVRKSKLLKWRD